MPEKFMHLVAMVLSIWYLYSFSILCGNSLLEALPWIWVQKYKRNLEDLSGVVIVWSIWCHRNDCVFNDFSFVGDKLLEETKYSFSHWQSNTAACIVDGHLQLLVSCLILAATEVWSFQLYGRRGFVSS